MRVLIDSSVWIDYFRSGNQTDELDNLIDSNLVFVNDLIIVQNAIQNDSVIFSLDTHFKLMQNRLNFKLY